jgi:hypothetical protein
VTKIKQAKDQTFISQTKYTRDILKKSGMDKAKPIKTPMGTNGHHDLDLGGTSVDEKAYRSMIGSLLYLCASMPDVKWIERVPLGHANFLGGPLSLGLQRNKTPLPYPRLKRSMSPLVVVVHNFYGCDKL